jgi:hypothetical protein
MNFTNPKDIAERGEAIYKEKYKTAFEEEHWGEFVAIDVMSEHAYIGESPEKALESARRESPQGIFHLIKVGSPGAFRVSYTNHASLDWLFQ